MYHLTRIISGGQTGADQAGLFVAERFGIPTGGWAPHGWRTSEGAAPTLLRDRFHLQEHPGDYPDRTFANVRDSDATLRLAVDFQTPGDLCTLRAIQHFRKPWLDIDLAHPTPASEIAGWLAALNIRVLNVAGNRERRETPGVFRAACLVLRGILEACGYTLLPRPGARPQPS